MVLCNKCLSKEYYWLVSKEQWQCKQYGFHTTLCSGTMLESSKLLLRIWYLGIAFIMSYSEKKRLTVLELQR